MILFTLIFLISLQLFGQQTINDTITHNNLQRDYILYVPANYDGSQAVPLLLNFHGYTSNAFQQMWYGDFRSISDTAGFIIAHPNGTLDLINNTHFNVGFGGSTVDDIGFTSDLIDTIASNYNIDLNRIYSTGMSNGGFMSYHLACNLSDRIAAIASVTGSMTSLTFNNCNPSHTTPVMQIHGTADPTVPYSGNTTMLHIDSVMAYWNSYNNTSLTADSFNYPDINTNDGSTATSFSFDSGTCGSMNTLIKVYNGGHAWPYSFIQLQGTNNDFNASIEVWNFLSKYSLNSLNCNSTNITKQDNSEDFNINIFPNPATDYINIEFEQPINENYKIVNTFGQIVMTGTFSDIFNSINISSLNNGTYFLILKNQHNKIIKIN